MECDFPAAHSMDSTWFAVDRDGHVALFGTGEAGAMPGDAATDEEEGLTDKLVGALPRTGALHDPAAGIQVYGDGTEQHHSFYESETKIEGVLMFLRSLDPVEEELNRGELFEVDASQGVAVVWRELPRATYQRLHENKDCLYCTYGNEDEDEDEDEDEEAWRRSPNLAECGLFSYTHVTDNWVAGPYARDYQPKQPITLDQLPPEVRRLVGKVRFNELCFRETPSFQPVEHVECEAWGAAYLASDGKTIRSIPGREEEYAGEYEEYAGDENFTAEPPPPGIKKRPASQAGSGLLVRILRSFLGR